MRKRRGIGLIGSVAALAGLGALGFAGFNVVRTGCPFGICAESAAAEADACCAGAAKIDCASECPGDEAATKPAKGACCELMADDDAHSPSQAGEPGTTP